MSFIAHMFQEGGFTMYWILYAALVIFGCVPLALWGKGELGIWAGRSALILSVVVLSIGFYGYRRGVEMTERGVAVAEASAEMKVALREEGKSEARVPLYFAGGVAGIALCAVAVSRLRRRKLQAERVPSAARA